MNLKDFKCRRCKRVVAQTTGNDIYFDGKLVPLKPTRIRFDCPHCQAPNNWQTTTDRNSLTTARNMS